MEVKNHVFKNLDEAYKKLEAPFEKWLSANNLSGHVLTNDEEDSITFSIDL